MAIWMVPLCTSSKAVSYTHLAFSRAFKAVYHTSPAGYRKNRLDVIISQKPKADQHLLAHLTQSLTCLLYTSRRYHQCIQETAIV